jgi:hypothetical protein
VEAVGAVVRRTDELVAGVLLPRLAEQNRFRALLLVAAEDR